MLRRNDTVMTETFLPDRHAGLFWKKRGGYDFVTIGIVFCAGRMRCVSSGGHYGGRTRCVSSGN